MFEEPARAVEHRRVADVTVSGEVKQASIPACPWHPLLPATFPAVSAGRALAGAPGVVTASRGVARQSDAAARRRLRMRTDTYPRDMSPTSEPVDVPIRDESIRLGQFLKLANLVESAPRPSR